jgi:hypothetical protein
MPAKRKKKKRKKRHEIGLYDTPLHVVVVTAQFPGVGYHQFSFLTYT